MDGPRRVFEKESSNDGKIPEKGYQAKRMPNTAYTTHYVRSNFGYAETSYMLEPSCKMGTIGGHGLMIRKQSRAWGRFLSKSLQRLLNQLPLKFSQMKPRLLPETAGVYLLTKLEGNNEIPYYIGRTKNIRQRLYHNHLMGQLSNARLKKYLIDNQICSTLSDAKKFIRRYCAARWIEEKDYRRRGALESYFTAVLFPEYGIDKEH